MAVKVLSRHILQFNGMFSFFFLPFSSRINFKASFCEEKIKKQLSHSRGLPCSLIKVDYLNYFTDNFACFFITSSSKGNDAHLRAIIQSEKKWKYQFFRRLRAANSVVRGPIWPNFKLIQALMYVIITCKYEKDPIKNNREKGATPFFKL